MDLVLVGKKNQQCVGAQML